MSSGSWRQADVGCPFYRHDDGARIITCEALIPDCDNKLRFDSKARREQQMIIFCCDKYTCCEHYRALMARYEEE